jgi:hypothetical protein
MRLVSCCRPTPDFTEQALEWFARVEERPQQPSGHAGGQCSGKGVQRLGTVVERLEHERSGDQDLDHAPHAAPGFGLLEQPSQRRHHASHFARPALGPCRRDEQPCEREQVELVQVGRFRHRRHLVLTCPVPRLVQEPLADVDQGPHRGDRAHVGEEAAQVHRLGLVQQLHRGLVVPLGTPQSGHGDVPSVAVLEERGPLAQLLARLEVVRRWFQVTLFQQDLAEPDVQVAKNGGGGSGVLLRRPQGTLVEPSRHPGLATNHPHLRVDNRAPELVGDVSRGVQAPHRLRVRLHSGLEVASPPRGQAQKACGSGSGEVVLRTGQLECMPGVRSRTCHVVATLGGGGPVDRDPGGKGPELVVRHPSVTGQGLQGAFGIAQPTLDAIWVSREQSCPRH